MEQQVAISPAAVCRRSVHDILMVFHQLTFRFRLGLLYSGYVLVVFGDRGRLTLPLV